MTLIPEGKYQAKPLRFQLAHTKNGSEVVHVVFEILDGEYAGTELQWSGYFTSDKTAERTIESLRYCGWDDDNIVTMRGFGSCVVLITVQDDTYNGVTKSRVAWVNEPKSAQSNHSPDFAAKFKALIVATKPKKAADSIPF